MAFCSKCGKQLSALGVCSCEQTGYTAVTKTTAANTTSVKDDCLNVLKKIFSPNPDDALQAAIDSKNHIWAVFGGLYVLFSSFAMMWIIEALIMQAIRAAAGPFAGFVRTGVRDLMPYGELFGTGFLLATITFAVLSGCIKLLYRVSRQDLSFVAVMNLVASSLFIFSAAMLAAVFFSFFFVQLSVLLIVTGAIGSLIMLYNGIQKTAPYNANRFWIFLGINAVTIIIVSFFGMQMLSTLIGRVVENIIGGGLDFFW